jgi:hypothetical protein
MILPLTPIWALIIGGLVLFLPGFAWLSLFWSSGQDIFERLAEAMGVSISLTALISLLAFSLDWQFSAVVVIISYLLLILISVWGCFQRMRERKRVDQEHQPHENHTLRHDSHSSPLWGRWFQYLVLFLIFLFILNWRFYQIRDVVLPLWVDSIHHVQIVKFIIQNNGLPENFEPYIPVPFYYHYAFHTSAAVFSFLSRLAPQQAVIILGQLISAGIAMAVYRLGKALWADWRRAGLSAVLVALATQMPAYYLTWGRYTLLTGLLLLPLAMAVALDMINKGARVSRFATFVVLTAGILLSHYFAAFLLAIFLILLFAVTFFRGVRGRKRDAWRIWTPLILASLLGFLLAAPWLYRMWLFTQGAIRVGAVQPTISAVENTYFPNYLSYLWRLAGPSRNRFLLFLAIPGLVISLFRRRTLIFGLWTIVLAIISLPWGLYLAPFRPDHAVIVLFLPTAILIADLFITGMDWQPWLRFDNLKNILILIILGILVGWGIWATRTVVNPLTVLATQADIEAMDWIEGNTPKEARFFINVAHWQFGLYRGMDGGWWITPITGRETILPSALYGMGSSDYTNQINEVAQQASRMVGCSTEFWDFVREQDLTHVYLNQGRGSVQAEQFENCSGVDLTYEKDGVYIYRIGDIIY